MRLSTAVVDHSEMSLFRTTKVAMKASTGAVTETRLPSIVAAVSKVRCILTQPVREVMHPIFLSMKRSDCYSSNKFKETLCIP